MKEIDNPHIAVGIYEEPSSAEPEHAKLNKFRSSWLGKLASGTLCAVAISGGTTLSESNAAAALHSGIDSNEPVSNVPYKTHIGGSIAIDCKNPPSTAPKEEQVASMLCLLRNTSPSDLIIDDRLSESARLKNKDIVECGQFSHFACNRPFNFHMPATDFKTLGENLAWGRKGFGTAQEMFKAWMRSASHRSIIMEAYWDKIGIAVKREGSINYWAAHFGQHDGITTSPAVTYDVKE